VAENPLTREEVFELVRTQLAEILEVDPASITENTAFVEDLHADSLHILQLVESLEAELGSRAPGFRINDEDLEDLVTVRDSVDYILKHVNQA
jgi:acyl carrier protein